MKVALGNDHAGYPLRNAIREAVEALGHTLVDFGTTVDEPCDFPEVVRPVTAAVNSGECEVGILVCGTGIGMSIAANKVKGIFAARCEDCYAARMAREHNAANVLTLGGRTIGPGLARDVVTVFLTTMPSPEQRHRRRQNQIRALEQERD